jgi:anti-sigma B factor antagonist
MAWQGGDGVGVTRMWALSRCRRIGSRPLAKEGAGRGAASRVPPDRFQGEAAGDLDVGPESRRRPRSPRLNAGLGSGLDRIGHRAGQRTGLDSAQGWTAHRAGRALNGMLPSWSKISNLAQGERKLPMELGIDVRRVESHAVVGVKGEIDVYTAPKLREKLIELVSEGTYDVVVDLENVDFLDSTGLGVLVGALKRVKAHDGSLSLVCTQDKILKIFKITGLTKVFPIHDSVEEAAGA